MNRIITVILFVLVFQISYSADYSKIDKASLTVPVELKTADEIAQFLCKNLNTPSEKARAVYFWIANNISYDFSMMKTNKNVSSKEQLVKEILEKRMGVCANYAELFNECCKAVGVDSYVISGFTKTNGKISDISHAWNAVKIDGKYHLIDPTWASGFDDNGIFKKQFIDEYFLVQPDEFIKTHMPFDPIWQFLQNPLSNKEFEASDFAKLKSKGKFNFNDSIVVNNNLDEYNKLIRETKRIVNQGITNPMVREIISTNQHNIKVQKFNQAIANVNKSVELYNTYIMSKNKQFNSLTMKDNQVLELLAGSRNQVETAEQTLQILNSDNSELNRLINDTQKSIKELKKKLDTEDNFMKKYLKTWKPLRIFLFTKFNV